ncbi:hypothetical protein Tco_0681976, partial [Tanacetum coccineum]
LTNGDAGDCHRGTLCQTCQSISLLEAYFGVGLKVGLPCHIPEGLLRLVLIFIKSQFDDDQFEEESMPLYDTDIEDVIEEEEGFIGKGTFGGEEDNIEDVVVVANDLCSSMIQTTANVPASRDACVSPPVAKESTVTLASTSLELLFNTVPTSSTAALEPNEEWVNAMVYGSDHEMTDGAANAKYGSMFVKGASYVVDDATELTVEGSKRVSSGPSDVVVALSTREKGDYSVPSSVVDEEVAATPFGF